MRSGLRRRALVSVAPAAKAPVKGKKTPAAKQKTKTKAKAVGLVYSSAQWKAYNKAYSASSSAAYQQLALSRATNRFRKYRLQAANATIAKAAVATHNAQAAAIAAYAAKQSWRQAKLANQNSALNARIEQDMFKHAQIAGVMQFIQGGQKAYAHRAVMRTVDTTQARSYEKAVFAAAARTAKRAKKTVSGKSKKLPNIKRPITPAQRKAIAAAAAAAGVAARGPGQPRAKVKAARKAARKAKGKAKGKPSARQSVANTQAARKGQQKKAAQSAKAPVKKPKGRTAPYQVLFFPPVLFDGTSNEWGIGLNDLEGTCIMAAVANALWHQTRWRLPDQDIAYWTGRATDENGEVTIAGVLHMLHCLQPWPEVKLLDSWSISRDSVHRIIGFGEHAAYAFGNQMVSYGRLVPVAADPEESWTCEFKAM